MRRILGANANQLRPGREDETHQIDDISSVTNQAESIATGIYLHTSLFNSRVGVFHDILVVSTISLQARSIRRPNDRLFCLRNAVLTTFGRLSNVFRPIDANDANCD